MDQTDSEKLLKRQAESNRMLKLILTDGVNDILATEIEKLDCLSVDVDVGTKLLIKPHMQILRSVHLLNNLN